MVETPELVVVIMAGGVGTRFWPLSTEDRPKQFLSLIGGSSLLRQSYDRVCAVVPPERVLVLTSAAFVPLVHEQLPEVPLRNIVGEPIRRDTAAPVVLSAALARRRHGNPVVVVLTADHHISPVGRFQQVLLSAARGAAKARGALYTFGIKPDYPAPAYGYLEQGEHLFCDDGVDHYRLLRFKEKPDIQTAKDYLASGRFLWNSGMFVWTAEAILDEAARLLPEHAQRLAAAALQDGQPGWPEALAAAFEPLPRISVDHGVMERAREVRCVAADFLWSDVGGFLALGAYMERDASGNACRGRVFVEQSDGNLVFCEDESETVALVGVQDLVVVRSGGKTLVCRRDQAESVKTLVAHLPKELV